MKASDARKLALLLYPDLVLKKVAKPVLEFGPELKALTDRMLEIMREYKGVGLAAPQVGQLLRVFVCNPTGEPGDDLVCVNPKLLDLSGSEEKDEGCLSLPGVNVLMRRATRAELAAFDVSGRPFERAAIDLLARIWQHETDHLDGKLITDHMSTADEIANRKALKQLKDQYKKPRRGRG